MAGNVPIDQSAVSIDGRKNSLRITISGLPILIGKAGSVVDHAGEQPNLFRIGSKNPVKRLE
nr:hypothetical protein JVH1_6752 [Rhodococcus sp. JVH1]